MSFHGLPCWFELMARDLDAAQAFYTDVLGWAWGADARAGFDYRLARSAEALVAGLMPVAICPEGTPISWMPYFAVDDCDATTELAEMIGGFVWKSPADIPGTGRFAVLADPAGAVFGILAPLPMDLPPASGAWNPARAGHGAALDLCHPLPETALRFYNRLFGWSAASGPQETLTLLVRDGRGIGRITGLGAAPLPNWHCGFAVPDLAASAARAEALGATAIRLPAHDPRAATAVIVRDPQGAWFDLSAPKP